MSKSRNVSLDHDDFIISVGGRLGDKPDWIRPELEWIGGAHGSVASTQVDAGKPLPEPVYVKVKPSEHPRGASVMVDYHGASQRLKGCRPGSWLLSPRTGWKWIVWSNGSIGWQPKDACLPDALRVTSRNDAQ